MLWKLEVAAWPFSRDPKFSEADDLPRSTVVGVRDARRSARDNQQPTMEATEHMTCTMRFHKQKLSHVDTLTSARYPLSSHQQPGLKPYASANQRKTNVGNHRQQASWPIPRSANTSRNLLGLTRGVFWKKRGWKVHEIDETGLRLVGDDDL